MEIWCNICAPDLCTTPHEAKKHCRGEGLILVHQNIIYYVSVTLVHQIRIKRGQFEATNKGAEEQAGKKTVAVMISPKQKILVKCRPKHSIENKCVHYENNHQKRR